MLCVELKKNGYESVTYAEYCSGSRPAKYVILRHDVDKSPNKALKVGLLENDLGIKASYYFRTVQKSYDSAIICRLVEMGHEIGYHYEDLSVARGRLRLAIELFQANLSILRRAYPVETICMHGSPLSRYDNRWLWKEYDYRDFGIAGEVYLDTDFSKVLYLTDTGRCWNGREVAVRDRVDSRHKGSYKSTFDIIMSLRNDTLPHRIMINTHPQRWHNDVIPWLRELIWQSCKNVAKKYVLVR